MAAPKSPSLGPKDLYLIAYNGLCCIGWAYVLFIGLPSFFSSVLSSDLPLIDALKAAGSSVYFATPATAGCPVDRPPSPRVARPGDTTSSRSRNDWIDLTKMP